LPAPMEARSSQIVPLNTFASLSPRPFEISMEVPLGETREITISLINGWRMKVWMRRCEKAVEFNPSKVSVEYDGGRPWYAGS